MTTYLLLHGAASDSWYWHLVAPPLRERGHDVVAPDLPVDDDSAGLDEYVAAAVAALPADPGPVVVVGQSMGALTAALVAATVPAQRLVLVAPMIPAPGETPGEWWETSGQARAQRESDARLGLGDDADVTERFFHDVPDDVVREALARGVRDQSATPFERPWPLAAWPDAPTQVVIGMRDRLFPPAFLRRLARERLGVTPDELDCGHVPALARPRELAALLAP